MSAVTPRKYPKQGRAKATVEAILEATAQLLLTGGFDKVSTNKIAQRAGISIGSLYQYFPNKEAIVIEVARRHADEMLDLLGQTARTLMDAPIEVAIRTYVRATLKAHALHPELHRVLLTQVMHLRAEDIRDLQERAQVVVRAWLEHHKSHILPKNLEVAAYMLVSIVEGVTHNTVFLGQNLVGNPALEDELVAVLCRYLLGSPDREGGLHGGGVAEGDAGVQRDSSL